MASKVKSVKKESPRYRYAQVESATADESKRTLQVAFSSEFPVERTASARDEKLGIAKRGEEYLELLSHNSGDYDISALNAPGAVVDEHDTTRHLGKVNHAEISADKKGRAVLEFDGPSQIRQSLPYFFRLQSHKICWRSTINRWSRCKACGMEKSW